MSNTTRTLQEALNLSKKIDNVNGDIELATLALANSRSPVFERSIAESKAELSKLSEELQDLVEGLIPYLPALNRLYSTVERALDKGASLTMGIEEACEAVQEALK